MSQHHLGRQGTGFIRHMAAMFRLFQDSGCYSCDRVGGFYAKPSVDGLLATGSVGPGFLLCKSLEPKAFRYGGLRVSYRLNAGVMRQQEGWICANTFGTVGMSQAVGAVFQEERGIQVPLDPAPFYRITASA